MAQGRAAVFEVGDPVIFLDQKGRSYLVHLKEGGRKDIRGHKFEHDAVISRPSNSTHEFAGNPKSAYCTLAVIWMSNAMIISMPGLTFLSIS